MLAPSPTASPIPQLSWKHAAVVGGGAVLAAGLIAALPGLGELRARLGDADPGWIALAATAELASCLAFVVALRGVMCGRLRWRFAYRVGMAAQGTNVLVPTGGAGGLALAAWALRRTGMAADRIARRTVALFVATSSVNFLTAIAAGTLVAAGLLPGSIDPRLAAAPAIAALAVVIATAAAPRALDRVGDRLPGRLTRAGSAATAAGLRDAGRLLRSPRSLVAAGAVGYMAFDVAALAAAFQAVGAAPELGALLVAYPLGQLGGLIPLPGGLGGTDGGLIGALVVYGTPLGAATAAVLAYRVFQLGLPALLGAGALGGLTRSVRREPSASAHCNPVPA